MLSSFSHVQLCATLWTVAHQAPLSMGFSRQEYWSGLPFPAPGDLPNPEIKPVSLVFFYLLHWEEDSLPLEISQKMVTIDKRLMIQFKQKVSKDIPLGKDPNKSRWLSYSI